MGMSFTEINSLNFYGTWYLRSSQYSGKKGVKRNPREHHAREAYSLFIMCGSRKGIDYLKQAMYLCLYNQAQCGMPAHLRMWAQESHWPWFHPTPLLYSTSPIPILELQPLIKRLLGGNISDGREMQNTFWNIDSSEQKKNVYINSEGGERRRKQENTCRWRVTIIGYADILTGKNQRRRVDLTTQLSSALFANEKKKKH